MAAKSLILNQLAQLTGIKTAPVSCDKVLLIRHLSATDCVCFIDVRTSIPHWVGDFLYVHPKERLQGGYTADSERQEGADGRA